MTTVEVRSDTGLRQVIRAGPHEWIADEPPEVGGEDAVRHVPA